MELCRLAANAIPIYSYTNPGLHSFCLCLYVKAGPLYEPDAANGVTHFWEHVAFRHIDASMDHSLFRMLDKYGMEFSGCTYKEFVQFKITGASRHFADAVDILARLFEGLLASSTDIRLERSRIKAEMREDDEKSSLEYFTQKIVWEGTPLQNRIVGTNAVLDRLGPTALKKAHRELLSPNNLFFYVTGCVDDGSLTMLTDRIGRLSLPITEQDRGNIAPIPAPFFHRNAQVAVKNDTTHAVCFSFDLQCERYTQAELDLLYGILFTGDTCKLYHELSDQTGLIYSYDAQLEKYCNIGNLHFQYEVQSKKLMESIAKVIAILAGLKQGLTDELEYAMPPFTENAELMMDSDEELNWNMAYDCHIMNASFRSLSERSRLYSQVTPDRIVQLCREIFRADNMVVTIKTDKNRLNVEQVRAMVREL